MAGGEELVRPLAVLCGQELMSSLESGPFNITK